ncbi:sigma 54-interacting transcriptional regulator [Desulfococcus sp.]|uniref:sigma 54-interacting transcriptional regulator n=1 Tax=Desulfococcus sp. TaxID=2025834 RepID=UPI0035945BD6
MEKDRFTIPENHLLEAVFEGTAKETGREFFKALVRHLCRALHTHGAWVTEYLEAEGRLKAMAFWLGNGFVPDYEYDIAGTPCEPVMASKAYFHVPDRVVELFPNDPDLPGIGAVSYMGVPLLDLENRILGHLAVLDNRPMPEDPKKLSVFRIFAARAAAELLRLRAEERIRERERKLTHLLDSAMDAIIELDRHLRVLIMNRAAEKMFQCSSEAMAGKSLQPYLTPGSYRKLERLVGELLSRPPGRQYLWITDGFQGRSAEGREFPAEATLSRAEMKRETLFTLIMRDVNDRREAERKIHWLSSEAEYLKEEIRDLTKFDEIIGRSAPMCSVLRSVNQVAPTDAAVLISGESGTGKELIARAVHAASGRRGKPLIKVNCGAIPEALMESEFFGHEEGAYTGATKKREGRFALAHGGTIFLDEIGEMPPGLQVKLLRVLQEGEFEPVGSSRTRRVDVRVIAATNRDLDKLMGEGKFRVDLYYRLNVFSIRMPALRERRGDIPLLAVHFLEKFARKLDRVLRPLAPDTLDRLQAYDWPGNVRELQNVIERAVIIATGDRLDLDPGFPKAASDAWTKAVSTPTSDDGKVHTAAEMQAFERRNLIRALESTGWQVSGKNGAAALLGMKPTTLSSRMKAIGIRRPG